MWKRYKKPYGFGRSLMLASCVSGVHWYVFWCLEWKIIFQRMKKVMRQAQIFHYHIKSFSQLLDHFKAILNFAKKLWKVDSFNSVLFCTIFHCFTLFIRIDFVTTIISKLMRVIQLKFLNCFKLSQPQLNLSPSQKLGVIRKWN